jgi:hypothetical protein
MSSHTSVVERKMRHYSEMDAAGLGPLLHPQAEHTAPGSDLDTDLEGQQVA